MIVKVLGTKFEVRGYDSEERINVILESGSVQLLHTENRSFDYVLKPGERADYDVVTQDINYSKNVIGRKLRVEEWDAHF